ncbi:MAG: signal peptidase I [Gemmatimonadota bacterium]|nr:MAG: signal peptidase I [Gemmatimonadota bacterium]
MKRKLGFIFILLLLFVAVRIWIFQMYYIPGDVMSPTIEPGDRVLVFKPIYKFRNPHRGEIVIFKDPRQGKRSYGRRCVAIGGDTIEMREGLVHINGSVLHEPYLFPAPPDTIDWPPEVDVWNNWGPYTVSPRSIFVMGDNRGAATDFDSRFDGMLDVRHVIGKVIHSF